MAGTEVIIEANPDSFKENVKLEDDAKDGDVSGKGGGARKKRRSSLFSSVSKATTILRCAANYLTGILVFGPTFSISCFNKYNQILQIDEPICLHQEQLRLSNNETTN